MFRIKSLEIENVRAIKHATINFAEGITVLIGENGAGKSTIIECLELLRKIPSGRFMDDLYTQHGGLRSLIRQGKSKLKLKVSISNSSFNMEYSVTIGQYGNSTIIEDEQMITQNENIVFKRNEFESFYKSRNNEWTEAEQPQSNELFLTDFGKHPPQAAITQLLTALAGIEVQLRFETLARWASVAAAQPSPLRGSSLVRPTTRLELLGRNLAAAWSVLKNERSAEEVDYAMHLVRMGLGEDVDSINLQADPSGGQVGLALRRRGVPDAIPAWMLSDGQLAWLAFVAMVRLNEGRSILAVDEPELHMHPYLINAVVALLQTVKAPVVIATHSDHILSMLEDPVASVRVCSLEEGVAAVRELDGAAFEEWRRSYADMGQLRASGFLELVLKKAEE